MCITDILFGIIILLSVCLYYLYRKEDRLSTMHSYAILGASVYNKDNNISIGNEILCKTSSLSNEIALDIIYDVLKKRNFIDEDNVSTPNINEYKALKEKYINTI